MNSAPGAPVAIVTAPARASAAATSVLLARAGYRVALVGRRKRRLKQTRPPFSNPASMPRSAWSFRRHL